MPPVDQIQAVSLTLVIRGKVVFDKNQDGSGPAPTTAGGGWFRSVAVIIIHKYHTVAGYTPV
ncbi:MAG TPA: hypothetical protein VFM78_01285, partial [Marinobacter sp.]|nr:hypothetical protein [Marinobacter sp.]